MRQTWTGGFFGFVFWLWMPLAGFQPIMIFTMQAISLLYQFWIHTEVVKHMGPLELVVNSPSHHRVHHATNPQYIDRNHAGTLIIWDRLFGSFEPEQETCVYGLTANINSYNYQDGADGSTPTPGGLRGPYGDVYFYSHIQLDAQGSVRFSHGLEFIAYGLDLNNEVFGFYQGSPQFMIQREYYEPTVAAGIRWSPLREK